MGGLGAINDNVRFSAGAAESLISLCTSAVSVIQGQAGSRAALVNSGLADFKGHFSELFGSNGRVQSGDAELLIARLRQVADGARQLKHEAAKEQRRREIAREWKRRQDNRNLLDHVHDFFAGDEDPPVGPPAAEVHISVPAASTSPRETPSLGSGGRSGGTSSARPEDLRRFARSSAGANDTLRSWPGQLRRSYDQFSATCHWGGLNAAGVWSGFDRYLTANGEDVRWANAIADAFAAAGGAGNISTLSDAALVAALRAADVDVSRNALTIDPPTAFGHPPTTGYADDPVNTLTGNFLENETDLGFTGGCASLVLTRTYNSCNPDIGGFGPGWSSWTETGLLLTDDAARWIHPDGRHVIFPRLGEAWDRATTENYWLERDNNQLVVTSNDGGTWRFTDTGRLVSLDRGAGTRVSLTYSDGRLVGLTHERGRHLTLDWDGARVATAHASDGRRIDYLYDDAGHLTAARGPLGTRTYRWSQAGLIEAVTDADGVTEAENTYDEGGRVTHQTSAYGRTTRYAYLPGRITVVSDPDGTRANTWIADQQGRLVGIIDTDDQRQSMAYDRWGNPVIATERDGATTLTEYDTRGRRTHQVTPSGADLHWGYDTFDRVTTVITDTGAITQYGYDGANRNPTTMTDPTGGITTMDWADGLLTKITDPTGVTVIFDYNTHGDLVATTDANGHTARLERDPAGRVTTAITPLGHRTTYNNTGTLASRKDPDGATWHYTYSPAGRLTTTTDPAGGRTELEHGPHGQETRTIDPLGRAITRTLDDLGNLARIELPDGTTWSFTHDALSRLIETIDPAGGVHRNDFDATGTPVSAVDPTGGQQLASINRKTNDLLLDDGLATSEVHFDALGRPTTATAADGSVAMAVYDLCGRPVELLDAEGGLTTLHRDAAGRVTEATTPGGAVTGYRYDNCGRLAATTDPADATTTYTYDADGRLVRALLPTGEAVERTYDAVGRVLTVVTPGRGVARYGYDLLGRVVRAYDTWYGHRRFSYDAAGQLVAVTNGNGGVTSYAYDELGRVATTTNPDGGQVRYNWNANNRLVAETDPLGRTTRAGYDAAGRQLWQEDPSGHRLEWAYDASGRPESVSADGRVVSAITRDLKARTVRVSDHTADAERVHEFEWDRRGHLIRRTSGDVETRWSYDADGRRVAMIDPDDNTTSYAYDAAGRLVEVDHSLLGRAAFSYDAASRLTDAVAGGIIQSWQYTDGWLTGHAVTDPDGARQTRLTRDEDGRITELDRDGETTDYGYDEAGQLVEARNGDERTSWTYDANGRLVAEAVNDQTLTHAYDLAGQLLATTSAAGTVRHSYDPLGRRTQTSRADGTRREYEWSRTGWLAGITDHAADRVSKVRLHVDANGELASVNDTQLTWDAASGGSQLLRAGDTPVVPLGAFTGIGDRWSVPGWRTARATGNDPWAIEPGVDVGGFDLGPSGQVTVGGLDWLDARAYDPTSRGFLSVDPLPATTGAGWAGNPYSYAGNNPLLFTDPTGLHSLTDAELTAYTAAHQGGALAATGDWVANNWEYLAGGAMVVAGGVLMATGVGGPAGLMLISAGADTIIQKATTGTVNWGQVGISGAVGGFGGVGAAARLGLTGLRATIAAGVMSGAAGGATSGAYSYVASPGPHTVTGFLGSTATGAALGGVMGGAGGAASHGLAALGGKLLATKGVTPLSDEIVRLAERNLTSSGDTVLGRYPGYITKAKLRGASYFDIGTSWEDLSATQRTAANNHFLDVIADRGDRVLLSTSKSDIGGTGALADEVAYLTEDKGYVWVNQWSLRPGG